ncbi:snoaL-like domain-containing protein [Penicillium sp. IBT 35674x]|nr:snoaL-like domain-containing protein [Penicillium sp. IBT 35674x]
MATSQNQNNLYNTLSDLPKRFFAAVDCKDLDGLIALFASDATLTVQTDHVTVCGTTEIRDMFARFMDSSVSMSHQITRVVVDLETRRIATEQRYSGRLADGTVNDMCNCNFFDVGHKGLFTRVVIWMGEGSPLK